MLLTVIELKLDGTAAAIRLSCKWIRASVSIHSIAWFRDKCMDWNPHGLKWDWDDKLMSHFSLGLGIQATYMHQ